MLVYLTSATWTRGATSVAFAIEVCEALRKGVHLLPVHEYPSVVDDDPQRGACALEPKHCSVFGQVHLQCPLPQKGVTPDSLRPNGYGGKVSRFGVFCDDKVAVVVMIADDDDARGTEARCHALVSSGYHGSELPQAAAAG